MFQKIWSKNLENISLKLFNHFLKMCLKVNMEQQILLIFLISFFKFYAQKHSNAKEKE